MPVFLQLSILYRCLEDHCHGDDGIILGCCLFGGCCSNLGSLRLGLLFFGLMGLDEARLL
jgi:hypothetical protein